MKCTAILLAASLLFVVSGACAQTSSEVEKEQAARDVPRAKPEQEKVDATADAQREKAKRLAAEPELTAEDMDKMDERSILALGNCQLAKYQRLYGEQALKAFTDRFVDEVAKAGPNEEVTSIQEALMAEGVSCTWHEIQPYAQ